MNPAKIPIKIQRINNKTPLECWYLCKWQNGKAESKHLFIKENCDGFSRSDEKQVEKWSEQSNQSISL